MPAGSRLTNWLTQNTLLVTLVVAGIAGGAAGIQQYHQFAQTEALRLSALADAQAGALRDRLNDRAMMIRAVSAAFVPPDDIKPGALDRLDPLLLARAGDIFSVVYIPIVAPTEIGRVEEAVAAMPGTHGYLFGQGFSRLTAAERAQTLWPIFDIMPDHGVNLRSVGLNLASLPLPRAAVTRALERRDIAVTAPLTLVQLPGEPAVVAYIPVRRTGSRPALLGMSFRTADLLAPLARQSARPLGYHVIDIDDPALTLTQSPVAANARPFTRRMVDFGGRRWAIDFYAPTAGNRLWQAVLPFALFVAAVVGLLLGSALTMLRQNERLSLALARQQEAETRLQVLVSELAHRIRNQFTIVQVVANQTFRPIDPDGQATAAFLGRMRALAATADLLTGERERDLADLVAASDLPFADRVHAAGPPVALGGQAGQSLSLALHELWTNALKYGALSVPGGHVAISWTETGDTLHWQWQEQDGPPPVTTTGRRGFGQRLLTQIVPRQLSARVEAEFAPEGYRYALHIPLAKLKAPRTS